MGQAMTQLMAEKVIIRFMVREVMTRSPLVLEMTKFMEEMAKMSFLVVMEITLFMEMAIMTPSLLG